MATEPSELRTAPAQSAGRVQPPPSAPAARFSPEQGRALLASMQLIRAFEEKAEELYGLGKVHGTMHLSIGQEATAVGAGTAMRRGDYLLNHQRGHGHCLSWFDSDINLMMAEFMGK